MTILRPQCKRILVTVTRFGLKLNTNIDHSLEAGSRRFGVRTDKGTAFTMRPEPHEYKNTTFRASYKRPSVHDKPNFRTRDTSSEFDVRAKLLKVQMHSDNLMTGYESNRQLWDGTSWRTEKNLHTDQVRTTYRNVFNKPKPFHLNKLKDNEARFKRIRNIYDIADNPTASRV